MVEMGDARELQLVRASQLHEHLQQRHRVGPARNGCDDAGLRREERVVGDEPADARKDRHWENDE
jgi:hypothetical protein